jgi:hypothetical protein
MDHFSIKMYIIFARPILRIFVCRGWPEMEEISGDTFIPQATPPAPATIHTLQYALQSKFFRKVKFTNLSKFLYGIDNLCKVVRDTDVFWGVCRKRRIWPKRVFNEIGINRFNSSSWFFSELSTFRTM